MTLGQLVERRHGRVTEQAERTAVGLDRVVRQPAEELVEKVEAHAAEPGLGPGAAGGAHDFRAIAPGGHERRDDLGRVLQVGVHRHHGVGRARVREAGGEGGLEAEIARELDQLEARVARCLRADERGGRITAAVVHQHGGPGALARLRVEERGEPREELGTTACLVEDGDDDGDDGGGHG